MLSDSAIRQQGYTYFLTEAQDLLHEIEQVLLNLRDDRTPANVHSLMRAAHTLKGAAASVGFDSIKTIAHSLEDVFKALYSPEVVIDAELESLLFEGYECLRLPLSAAIAGTEWNDADVLHRAEAVMAELHSKLGKHFNPNAALLSSNELGFDITQSIFETGVNERLDQLATVLVSQEPTLIAQTLQTQAEVFVGLAESLNLPGFGAIARQTLTALSLHPDQAIQIATTALADFRQGQAAVLAGDRSRGGAPSPALQQWAKKSASAHSPGLPTSVSSLVNTAVHHPRVQELTGIWHQLVTFLNRPVWVQPEPMPPSGKPEASQPSQPQNADTTALGVNFIDFNDLASDLSSVDLSSLNEFSTDPEFSERIIDLEVQPIESGNLAPKNGLKPRSHTTRSATVLPEAAVTPFNSLLDVSSNQPVVTTEIAPNQRYSLRSHPSSSSRTPQPPQTLPDTVRVNLNHLDSLNHCVSELLINQNQQALQDEQLQTVMRELLEGLQHQHATLTKLRDWADQWSIRRLHTSYHSAQPPSQAQLSDAFDALELDHHGDMHVLLQAALENLVQLEATTDVIDLSIRQSSQTLKQQGRLLTNVRDDLMDARMTPIGTLLNRFPRLLEQLAESYGKVVSLHLKGTQVLVDKAIAEKLFDPLLHLIRNAFDHGIEAAEVRLQQGKPEMGRIQINAYQQGNRTVIEVQDDGRGLDLKRICQRGYDLQLLLSNQVEHFSTAELLNLLFEPGFSTIVQVSELSGRGVGLDVVRSQLRSLNGSVTVQSELNRGTTFSLHLPLTLMTARLLVCRVGQAVYAFMSDEIEKILIPSPDQIETRVGQSVFHWQQETNEYAVPVCYLAQLMQYSASSASVSATQMAATDSRSLMVTPILSTPTNPLLLVRGPEGFLGITVDQIIGEQELVIRPVGTCITPPAYVYGCSILGDGRLTLVLDGATIATQGLKESLAGPTTPPLLPLSSAKAARNGHGSNHPALPGSIPRSPASQPILVIDDSATVRQMLTLSLEQAGYSVIQAQDGLEAIAQLKRHRSIQLITCDIEMPRLNGFEFLMRYRQDTSLTRVPVLMLSSRSSEKHRQLALQLGASVYLTKPYTDEELLKWVAELAHR